MISAFFIKLIWPGVGFLNRTGAEIGYQLDKKLKIIIFLWKRNENDCKGNSEAHFEFDWWQKTQGAEKLPPRRFQENFNK